MECRKFWTKGWPGKCCGRHKGKLEREKQVPKCSAVPVLERVGN